MKFRKFIKESVSDMDKRCPDCNELLNDMGTCPFCDEGEEDTRDLEESKCPECNEDPCKCDCIEEEIVKEDLTNREKLLLAYPELNFDRVVTEDVDSVVPAMSNKEKLLRAFPELNFNNSVTEEIVSEEMSVRDKLKAAYPELNFDSPNSVDDVDYMFEDFEDTDNTYDEYDDNYDFDDVEADRAHATLYGGDRMYCDCGAKLKMDEWGGFCPVCDAEELKMKSFYAELDECNESLYSEDCEYRAKETSYDIAYEIAQLAKKELKLPAHEVEMLEHDINNLRANEWVESFAKLSDSSEAKQLFFQNAVEPDCE